MNQMMMGSGSATMSILWLVGCLVVFYIFLIKPQKKQQNMRNKMLNGLKVNDRILSVGGITGYIRQLTDKYVYVEIADGLVVEMSRQYIAMVLNDEEDFEDDEEAEDISEETEEVEPKAIEAAEETAEQAEENDQK